MCIRDSYTGESDIAQIMVKAGLGICLLYTSANEGKVAELAEKYEIADMVTLKAE